MTDKLFVSTPLYYVNDVPHIGHAYTTLAADIIARYWRQRLGEENVFFLTGTDEHGTNVAQAAERSKKDPKEYADEVAPRFSEAWKLLNINYDFFIRTTDKRHEKIAQAMLQKIYANGWIYPGTYEGFYCVGCEKFLAETDIVDRKCPLHPTLEPEYQKEKNYFFKLREFVPRVLEKIKQEEYQILPETRKNEIISKLQQPFEDISISRAGVSWGIPIPWDNSQTIYVWVEALFNYYSATQFVEGKKIFWPADLHLIGKDILWFHAVIWPALLLAAELPLPRKLFAHGFFTIEGQKMSKTLGNVIRPTDLVKRYGVDGSRYILFATFPFGSDGDFSWQLFNQIYTADLANGLGNYVARIAKLGEKCGYVINETQKQVEHKADDFHNEIQNLNFSGAIGIANHYIRDHETKLNKDEPWNIDDNEKLKEALKYYIEGVIATTKLLQPFLPETAEKILKQFSGKIKSQPSLFPRLN